MNDLLAARSQMAMSLAFHIIFAAIGIAMPLLMVIAEWKWLRTKDEVYLTLAKRWAKGTAILFAVGAVSGTVLSFELGLLWPAFMGYAGAIIGMPFSLEGFAFFTEAIFLGIYLYGWNRVPPQAHLFAGAMVAISGALSGIFVVIANAWMNTPTGFRVVDGKPVDIDPLAAMMNPAAFAQTLHMTLASYAATGFVVAGIHAFMLRRDANNRFHKSALAIALTVGGVAAILQPLSGDLLAKMVAKNLPVKLAALEGQFGTEKGAPLRIGGIPDEGAGVTRYAIQIPYGLSILAYNDPNATVKGLNDFPAIERPPVAIVHLSFQIMVAGGVAMLASPSQENEGMPRSKMVSACDHLSRAAGLHRHRDRLGRHGSRPSAVDYLWRDEDGPSSHARTRAGRAFHYLHIALCLSGRHHGLVVTEAGRSEPASLWTSGPGGYACRLKQ